MEHSGPSIETRFFAHTLPDRPLGEGQALEQHLEGVALLAARNASAFDGSEWAYLAGLWHDLGKFSGAFQEYLRETADAHEGEMAGRVDHSTAGAKHAVDRLGLLGHLLAFPIAGHHSGLLDSIDNGACMAKRLTKEDIESWDAAPREILDREPPDLPAFMTRALAGRDRDGFAVSFFVRMLFSALIDADRLDTERFVDPERSRNRAVWPNDIMRQMAQTLAGYHAAMKPEDTDVNKERADVLAACLRAAGRPPGLFSLTVPTGGGKTLSSLAFALNHAASHGLRRVIYVVPFTSIIEQNADEFRKVMAPLAAGGVPAPVVEHHSNLDPERETTWSRLATENWDAPLVVTTSVQFYESLFSNRTSRCRKLHNLARSVIILDEVQALPVDYLAPCLRALDQLTRNYGATIVLCTATQPAIERREDFPIGLEVGGGNEIVPNRDRLFQVLRRVDVTIERDPLPDDELARRIAGEKSVLCIVNTRRHARMLAHRIGREEGHFHLSALMCPEHRSLELSRIRNRLDVGLPCRVVATRLVEAGVDLDFPVVYRSLAGLDSITQAAGRCNRNGRLERGRTVVFTSQHQESERFLADTAGTARQILDEYDDPLDLAAVEHYFRLYFWEQKRRWDLKGVLGEFTFGQERDMPLLLGFRRAGENFRLIEDSGRPIIIPWGVEGEKHCSELRGAHLGPSMELLRKLQRFTVQVPEWAWRASLRTVIDLVHDRYAVLAFPDRHYGDWTGLELPGGPTDALIA